MDPKVSRIAVGLALESALSSTSEIHDLESLYSNPQPELLKELHDSLIDSPNHWERVIAIWLQLSIDQGPITRDPSTLIAEMSKMEVLLGVFINQSGKAWRDVNDWMNYIANSHQHLLNGFWTDSKILLSRGLEISKRDSIEVLKENEELFQKVSIFQEATASYYNELKELPIKLFVPEEVLDTTLLTQEVMLDLMKNHGAESPDEIKLVNNTGLTMSQALRDLMSSLYDDAKHNLTTARNSLDKLHGIIQQENKQKIKSYLEKLEKILLFSISC